MVTLLVTYIILYYLMVVLSKKFSLVVDVQYINIIYDDVDQNHV